MGQGCPRSSSGPTAGWSGTIRRQVTRTSSSTVSYPRYSSTGPARASGPPCPATSTAVT
ncbi:hypothetical protein ACFFX0_20455 [Citricoccus parietis]|uniref:Uncharacterized protein n=1 Tax=Citricoccus parietis TaxID=592307 RepID=A0ABV5G4N2_9MICC